MMHSHTFLSHSNAWFLLYQPVPFLWERMLLLLIFPVSDSYKSIDLVLISASLVQRKILRHYP